MVEIQIPEVIKVGGLDYRILCDEMTTQRLRGANLYGQSDSYSQEIRLVNDTTPQRLMGIFIHEILHAVDNVYNDGDLEEKVNSVLASGLLQVFEQLNIRLVLKRGE